MCVTAYVPKPMKYLIFECKHRIDKRVVFNTIIVFFFYGFYGSRIRTVCGAHRSRSYKSINLSTCYYLCTIRDGFVDTGTALLSPLSPVLSSSDLSTDYYAFSRRAPSCDTQIYKTNAMIIIIGIGFNAQSYNNIGG